jgi:hypothetical protein
MIRSLFLAMGGGEESHRLLVGLLLDPAHLLGAPDLHPLLWAPARRAEDEHGPAIGRRHLPEHRLELPVVVPDLGRRARGRGPASPGVRRRRRRQQAPHALLRLELDVVLDGLAQAAAPRPAAPARAVRRGVPRQHGGPRGDARGQRDARRGRVARGHRGHGVPRLGGEHPRVGRGEEGESRERREERERVDHGQRGVVAEGGEEPAPAPRPRRGGGRERRAAGPRGGRIRGGGAAAAVLLEGAEELDEAAAVRHGAAGGRAVVWQRARQGGAEMEGNFGIGIWRAGRGCVGRWEPSRARRAIGPVRCRASAAAAAACAWSWRGASFFCLAGGSSCLATSGGRGMEMARIGNLRLSKNHAKNLFYSS